MRKLQLAKMVAAGTLVLGLALSANAGVFTFTGSGITAVGSVNTVNGTATAGSLTVFGGADSGVWSLYNIGDIPANDGGGLPSGAWVQVGNEIVDNWFYVNDGPQVDWYGLLFEKDGALLNLCSAYQPWPGGSVGTVYEGTYSLQDGIIVGGNLACGTPDGGMTVTLLGGALMGLAALRRKLFC